jgi:hypothetical protein
MFDDLMIQQFYAIEYFSFTSITRSAENEVWVIYKDKEGASNAHHSIFKIFLFAVMLCADYTCIRSLEPISSQHRTPSVFFHNLLIRMFILSRE